MKKTNRIIKIGNLFGYTGGSFGGQVYSVKGLALTLNCMGGATGSR